MNCDKYLDLISARLDGQLTVQEEADLTAHLQTCPTCRAIAKDMEGLHSALAAVGEVDAPPELSQTVLSKIRVEKRPNRRRTLRQLSALAACLVLCVGVLRVADATYSERNRQTIPPSTEAHLPNLARYAVPESVALTQSDNPAYTSCQKERLSGTSTTPSAHLLDSAGSLSRFLARFPNNDLSGVAAAYDEQFFHTNRLLAVVVQEPSSSITHTISGLTADTVTVLRHVPEVGDSDMALWLLLTPTELAGPERTLTVELINQ